MIHPKKTITINPDAGMIYRMLLAAGFSGRFAAWMTAQAAHETGNFTSYIYQNNKNAFGMKYGPVHPHSTGEKNGYADYATVNDSVEAYKDLYKSYGIVSVGTIDSFVKLLRDQKYFEAPYADYLAGVKFYYKLYFPLDELHKDLVVHGGGGTF